MNHSTMKRWVYFIVALALYMTVHEFFHAFMSALFHEFAEIRFHWYGPEVIFLTPVEERSPGIQWFFISGISNVVTMAIGYLLYSFRRKIIALESLLLKNILFYVAVVFLLFDAVNLSLGPFLYGSDACGIATGLNVKPWIIQALFGIILLINRELIVILLDCYGIVSRHILFRSWYRKRTTDA